MNPNNQTTIMPPHQQQRGQQEETSFNRSKGDTPSNKAAPSSIRTSSSNLFSSITSSVSPHNNGSSTDMVRDSNDTRSNTCSWDTILSSFEGTPITVVISPQDLPRDRRRACRHATTITPSPHPHVTPCSDGLS
jgi:hypothetical protein